MSNNTFEDEIATSLAKAFDEFFPLYALVMQLSDGKRKTVLELVGKKSEVLKTFDEQRRATGE